MKHIPFSSSLTQAHSIKQCADKLPDDRKTCSVTNQPIPDTSTGPRYSMGIGFAEGASSLRLESARLIELQTFLYASHWALIW